MVKKELAFQGRGCVFDPWLGNKIPHAAGQLSPRTTTTELAHLNERARVLREPGVLQTTEPTCPGAGSPQLEKRKPVHRN